MKNGFLFVFTMTIFLGLSAQPGSKDSILKAANDSIKMAKLEAKLVYPLIKAGKWSGIVPVSNVTEIPDPHLEYKLLFELVANNKEADIKEINNGFTEVCRIINLHVAAGIPPSHIKPVIVVHGHALMALLNNENFKKKYNIDNPNISVIQDLVKKTNGKLIACGQAMSFFEITKEDMIPEVNVSLTAQTALSSYQIKGYQLMEVKTAEK